MQRAGGKPGVPARPTKSRFLHRRPSHSSCQRPAPACRQASQSILPARGLGKRERAKSKCCIYRTRKTRDETINLRATQRQKALIDRAADALGRNRSDFMLETACNPSMKSDRKSTRLNSSHANISYAVFCLKKKKKHKM